MKYFQRIFIHQKESISMHYTQSRTVDGQRAQARLHNNYYGHCIYFIFNVVIRLNNSFKQCIYNDIAQNLNNYADRTRFKIQELTFNFALKPVTGYDSFTLILNK